ncbi:1-phosphatidylinositol phosphodiesterase-like [Patiria miniata]|uniref:Phosphatidylinositol-specific phospholipase C X domain-containing protein n=1 Tax=Patiria miniata TaxID=46514 RepID=A0A913ZX14_PATMI|nr:1-phosphatidylinositol phosphodiesterase-like [Patiria miniata]
MSNSDVSSTKDWMSGIPDDYSLTNLSIPGTHETMSLYGGPPKQCQTMSLSQQYDAGIRFVDIRCRHYNDELPIFHDEVPQQANFSEVLKSTTEFLDLHPTEVILMRLKEEYKPKDNTQTFAQTVQGYVEHYPRESVYRGESYPTMKDVRGKLVILRDYDGPADFGLPYADLDVEDLWQVPSLFPEDIGRKWNATRDQLETASQGPIDTVLYLTYSSGASAFAFPEAIAERINRYLSDFLSRKARWGMVAMDFPDAALIDKIINSNV